MPGSQKMIDISISGVRIIMSNFIKNNLYAYHKLSYIIKAVIDCIGVNYLLVHRLIFLRTKRITLTKLI